MNFMEGLENGSVQQKESKVMCTISNFYMDRRYINTEVFSCVWTDKRAVGVNTIGTWTQACPRIISLYIPETVVSQSHSCSSFHAKASMSKLNRYTFKIKPKNIIFFIYRCRKSHLLKLYLNFVARLIRQLSPPPCVHVRVVTSWRSVCWLVSVMIFLFRPFMPHHIHNPTISLLPSGETPQRVIDDLVLCTTSLSKFVY